MAGIVETITLIDGTSKVLMRIANGANDAAISIEKAQGSVDKMKSSLNGASSMMNRVGASFSSMISQFALGNLAANAITSIAYALSQMPSRIMAASDNYTGMQARLEMVAGSAKNAAAMNDMIYQSALRARGSYDTMLDSVAKIAMTAKDAFPDARQVVPFVEEIQKLFAIGGTGIQQQKDAMLQLTQALGSGRLQGDEFRSIAEAAPLIEQMVAKELGVTQGELKKLSSQGLITADILKNAILDNANEINAQFEKMPMTWSSMMQNLGSIVERSMVPVFQELSSIANSAGMRSIMNDLITGIQAVVPVFYGLVKAFEWGINLIAGGITAVSDFINEHGLILQGVLITIGAGLAFVAAQMAVTTVEAGLSAVAIAAKTVADWLETAALIAMTVAQDGLNAAIYACPLTWIIGAVIAFIAAIYFAVAVVNHFAGTNISATGIIFAAFTLLFVGIRNLVATAWNMFLSFGEFIANFAKAPLAAVYNLFADIWNGILDLVGQAVAEIIDEIAQIPGIKKLGLDLSFHPHNYRATKKSISGGYNSDGDKMAIMDPGASAGNVYGQVKAFTDNLHMPSAASVASSYDGGAGAAMDRQNDTLDNIAGNTGDGAAQSKKIADTLDSSEDDLRYLRELAEREAIDKYTTASVTIEMGGITNQVSSDVDIDGIVDKLTSGLRDGMVSAAREVHA